ncbi:hypothetical protein PMI07_005206 [Rhizobium sp. CF080]|uniref:hypothetical protein n=1 Tax=Rhizobium sp. (strain CF080) TaxID=1144310 RepID=UPI000271D5A8|nr:hypothetical protein [Rhizobium sp. CF080]EUB98925.1 hypothetical protein PMI07_005206 [Rhizobium sp. CF080]
MLFDDSRFPLVFLRTQTESAISINEQFEQLLDKRERFVVITDHSPDDHEDETQEERKEKALFFKRIKHRMREFCCGMVVIEGQTSASAVLRVAATAAAKAFGFAILFVSDEEQAVTKGLALLEKHAA